MAMRDRRKLVEQHNTVEKQKHDSFKPNVELGMYKEGNLAVIGGTVNMRNQSFVVAAWKMVTLENGLLAQHRSISLLYYLLGLLGYQHPYH